MSKITIDCMTIICVFYSVQVHMLYVCLLSITLFFFFEIEYLLRSQYFFCLHLSATWCHMHSCCTHYYVRSSLAFLLPVFTLWPTFCPTSWALARTHGSRYFWPCIHLLSNINQSYLNILYLIGFAKNITYWNDFFALLCMYN